MITQVQSNIAPKPGISLAVYYAKNIVAATASSNILTVTFNQPTLAPQVGLAEFANVGTAGPLDTHNTNSGNSAQSTVNLTTTAAIELLVSAVVCQPGSTTTNAASPYSALFLTGTVAVQTLPTTVPANNGFAITTIDPPGPWISHIMGFRCTTTPAQVTSYYGNPGGEQTTVHITATVAQTVGHFNLVTIAWFDASAAVDSVTDSKGNVYQLATGPSAVATTAFVQSSDFTSSVGVGDLLIVTGSLPSGNNVPSIIVTDTLLNKYQQFGVTLTVSNGVAMWLFSAVSVTSGTNTVTVNYSSIQNGPSFSITEWANDTGWLFNTDGYAMRANPFGTLMTSNPVITTNQDDLLFATYLYVEAGGPVVAPGWITQGLSSNLGYAWQEVNSPGSYKFVGTQGTSGVWAVVLWAFPTATPTSTEPITFNVTTSYLKGTSFKEVYPNRIPEDIYDSLLNTPTFVYNQFGPNYGT